MSNSIKINGLAELQQILSELPAKIETNIIRSALRAGARTFRDQARSMAPVAEPTGTNIRLYGGRAGLLRDSIKINAPKFIKGNLTLTITAGGKVKGAGAGDAYYANWVELGTKAHLIKSKTGGRLALGGRRKVIHPGAKPRPFMRPAFNVASAAAVLAFAAQVKKRLTKEGIETPDLSLDGDT